MVLYEAVSGSDLNMINVGKIKTETDDAIHFIRETSKQVNRVDRWIKNEADKKRRGIQKSYL